MLQNALNENDHLKSQLEEVEKQDGKNQNDYIGEVKQVFQKYVSKIDLNNSLQNLMKELL